MAKKFQYGLGGFKNLGSTQDQTLEDRVKNLETEILSGRVIEIDPTTGMVRTQILDSDIIELGYSEVNASPLNPSIKNYPLINETITLFRSISFKYQDNPYATQYYYHSPLNLWNEVNSHELQLPTENISTPSQNKSYQEVEVGSTNKPSSTTPDTFKPGTYFVEKSNVLPLYPFEGDVIFEGRWGNTIRFGSTNTNSPISSSWSNLSQFNGDPITIIDNTRNNSPLESFSNDSSIWLTSTQKLPITGSSTDYTSYTNNPNPPLALNQYSNNPQIVLNSGRLVFNTTQDHLMLSSKKTINLNSVEGVNIDTRGNFVIQSPQVYLGDSDDSLTQPVVLGDDLVSLLTDILDDLSTLTRTLQNQVGVPVGTPLAPTSLTAQLVADKIPSYQRRVSQLLSNTTRTAI